MTILRWLSKLTVLSLPVTPSCLWNLPTDFQLWGSQTLDRSSPSPWLLASKTKQIFLSTNLVSLMAFEQWVARLHFCLEDKWIKKKKDVFIHMHICIHSGLLLSHKKELNNAICSNMEEPRAYHTKWSKSGRERQIPYDVAYTWDLKYDTNELLHKREADSQTERTGLRLPREKGDERGRDCEFGTQHSYFI